MLDTGEIYSTVTSGKYTFNVKRNIVKRDNTIVIHTYKVGGDYEDCVNISYVYDILKDVPLYAKLPHIIYEPECSMGSDLERGGGSETLIKTAMRVAYKDVSSVTVFKFDDMSHIDCEEKDMGIAPQLRKPKKPLNLAYLFIAYHDKTWYESRFHAVMSDSEAYKKYRSSLSFLKDPSMKPSFLQFLNICNPPTELHDCLEKIYEKTSTYRDFFEAIPKKNRCHILRPWLNQFMKHYIGTVFSTDNWQIDITKMDNQSGGGRGGTRKSKIFGNQKYRIFQYKTIDMM